jgi:hypothetical protein
VAAGPRATAPPDEPAAGDAPLGGDLAELFADATEEQDVEVDDVGLPSPAAALDLDLSPASIDDASLDDEIGWSGRETALSPTIEATAVRALTDSGTVEGVDLHTLAQRAIDDEQISQTLRDALTLLESDYESELTASQVIDRAKLQQALDEGAEDELARTGTDRHRR